MAVLHLIRHGQASLGAADYDVLSELGVRQCYLLGKWWRERQQAVPHVVVGPMRRHQQSLVAFAEGYGDVPVQQQLPALAEFDHEDVLHVYRPEYADKAALMKALLSSPDPRREFRDVFAAAVQRWHDPVHAADYKECWADFRARVLAGYWQLRDMRRDALVFTSGGVISVMLQDVLGLDDARSFALNAVTANSSVSRLLHRDHDISLAGFNHVAHLEAENDAALITLA